MGCCFSVKNEIEEPILETCQQYPPGTQEKYNCDWKDYDQIVANANQFRKKYNNVKLGRIPAKNPET